MTKNEIPSDGVQGFEFPRWKSLMRRATRLRLSLLRSFVSYDINENIFLFVLALIVGVVGGLAAYLLETAVKTSEKFFLESGQDFLNEEIGWYFLLPLIPATGGLLLAILRRTFPDTKGHGVPEVMESIALKNGFIRLRVFLLKIVAPAISIGSGGSVGVEGPIAATGSAGGSAVGQFFGVKKDKMRILVGCGAAAGISAIFHAPIAGVMFALEVILGDFAVSTFSPVIIASVIGTITSESLLGKGYIFTVPSYEIDSAFELANYLVLGVITGAVAAAFVKILLKTEDLWEKIPINPFFKPVLGGFVVGVIGLFLPQLMGGGYTTIGHILSNDLGPVLLGFLFIFKYVATTTTLSSGGSGGIMAPSLFLGAVVGGLFGQFLHFLIPSINPTGYALVGMGAVLGGTTHASLSAILIIFEMTGDYKIILPLMFTVIVATLVSKALAGNSVYTGILERKGVKIQRGKDISVLENLGVTSIINYKYTAFECTTPVREIIPKLRDSELSDFPVVSEDGKLEGLISFNNLRRTIEDDTLKSFLIAEDVMDHQKVSADLAENLLQVFNKFVAYEVNLLPVTDSQGTVVGIVKKDDLLERYQAEIEQRA